MINDATINFIKGDTCSRDFTISGYDEEINKILFTIKNNENDKRSLMQKSLEIDTDNMFNKDYFPNFNGYINIPYQQSIGTITANDGITQRQYKISYVKCRPNTKYTVKINNENSFFRIGTTTEIPSVGTTIKEIEIISVDGQYSKHNMTYLTGYDAKYLVFIYYATPLPDTFPPSEQEVINSLIITMTTIEDGITLVSDEDGVKTYNLLINANDTDKFKTEYEYFFAIKIFTYVEDADIELTPIKGTLTLSVRGD